MDPHDEESCPELGRNWKTDLIISPKCGSWVHISHGLKKCMLRVYYNSDTVVEITDPNIIRTETLLSEIVMFKGRAKEVNGWPLKHSVMVGVMGRARGESQE